MSTRATTLWSLTKVKDYAKATSANHDNVLVTIADRVSEQIDAFVRRPFVTREVMELRIGSGTSCLRLRNFPVPSVSEAKYRARIADAWTVLDASAYELDTRLGELHLKSGAWPKATLGVSVTYETGFGAQDSPDLPADVSGAGLDFVKLVYDRFKADAIALSTLSVQMGGSAVMVPKLPGDVTDALAPYVKRRL